MNIKQYYKSELMYRKVFVRSNEDEPLIVGAVVAFKTIGGTTFPVVKCDKDSKEYKGGLIFPYSKAMERVLGILNPREQWDYLSGIVQTIRSVDNIRNINYNYGDENV